MPVKPSEMKDRNLGTTTQKVSHSVSFKVSSYTEGRQEIDSGWERGGGTHLTPPLHPFSTFSLGGEV